jgi:predicted transcriptional regulator
MNTNPDAVGEYLRTLRRYKGLSITKLAAELDTVEAQIRKIENGQIDTRFSMVAGLCRILGGDITDLAYLALSKATRDQARDRATQWLQAHGDQAAEQAQRVAESPVGYNVTSHQE